MDTYSETARLLQTAPVTFPGPVEPPRAHGLHELRGNTAQQAGRLQRQSAAELMAIEFPPLPEIVSGLLTAGLFVLAGAPKAKKSFLSLALALHVCTGRQALGQFPVDRGPCLYFGLEDGGRRIQKRLRYMLSGNSAPDNLHIYYKAPRMPDFVGLLEAEIKVIKPKLVFIDVFQKIRPLTGGNKLLYQQDYSDVSALKALADDYELCICIVHHTRKMGDADDIFNTLSGSTGLTGAADGVLILKKSGTTGGVLHTTGRDIEQQELALEFDTHNLTWRYIGDAAEIMNTEGQQLIYDAIKNASEPLSPSELITKTGLDANYVYVCLHRMVEAGDISKHGRGKYSCKDCKFVRIEGDQDTKPYKLTDLTTDIQGPACYELDDAEFLP